MSEKITVKKGVLGLAILSVVGGGAFFKWQMGPSFSLWDSLFGPQNNTYINYYGSVIVATQSSSPAQTQSLVSYLPSQQQTTLEPTVGDPPSNPLQQSPHSPPPDTQTRLQSNDDIPCYNNAYPYPKSTWNLLSTDRPATPPKLLFLTSDSVSMVEAGYSATLKQEGWLVSPINSGNSNVRSLRASKGNRILTVRIEIFNTTSSLILLYF